MIAIRRENPVFRKGSFFEESNSTRVGKQEIYWLNGDDSEMQKRDWGTPGRGALGVLLTAEAIDEVDRFGRRLDGENMLLLINADDADAVFRLTRRAPVLRWERLFDTWLDGGTRERRRFWKRGEDYTLRARSVALFRGVPRKPRGGGRA